MPDDKSTSQSQDRERIDVNQEHELRAWARSMNTTPEQVRQAVEAVGDRADRVREFVGQRESS